MQWLRKSHYTDQMMVSEQNQCHTYFYSYDDSYFKEKEHYLNTMVNVEGLPTLFITLSIADSKWIYLTAILIMVIRSLLISVRISYSVIVH